MRRKMSGEAAEWFDYVYSTCVDLFHAYWLRYELDKAMKYNKALMELGRLKEEATR